MSASASTLHGSTTIRPIHQSTNLNVVDSAAVTSRPATKIGPFSSAVDGAVIDDEIFWTYVAVVCVTGVLLNTIVIRSLCRAKLNGTLHFILQLTICDIVSLLVGAIELRYMQHRLWSFPPDTCAAYLGTESVCSTATFYLLIAINLHAISTYNLARKTIRRDRKHDGDSSHQYTQISQSAAVDNDDYEVSVDVAPSPAQCRSLTINYSQPKRHVAVLFPVLFVWFLAVSVSTPLFVLGSVLPSERMPLVCGIVNFDSDNNQLMQTLFMTVRIAIPVACLMLTLVSVAWKQSRVSESMQSCGLDEDVKQVLRLALVLSVLFICMSGQRVVGSLFFEVWTRTPFMLRKYPRFSRLIGIALGMAHWSASLLRPVAYILVNSDIRAGVWRSPGIGKRIADKVETESRDSHPNEQRLL